MKRLCTICARGGSKGIPNKNIRDVAGKPLIAYSILQAKTSKMFDYIAVSSDAEEILEISSYWGADVIIRRPPELAADHAAKLPTIQHCVRQAELLTGHVFQVIVDLDATSPLRNVQDIKAAIWMLEAHQAPNVITAMPSRRSPYFNIVEIDETGAVQLSKPLVIPVVRRQDAPLCYDLNASIYVWQRDSLHDSGTLFHQGTMLYIMPEERSIDIDTELDWELVSLLMRNKVNGDE